MTIALVSGQQKENFVSGSATNVTTLPSSTTAGNSLWIAVAAGAGNGVDTITSAGATWAQAGIVSTADREAEIWLAKSIAGGSGAITVTCNNADSIECYAEELSGVGDAWGFKTNSGTGTSIAVPTMVAPAGSYVGLIMYPVNNLNTTSPTMSPWTLREAHNFGNVWQSYWAQSVATEATLTGTLTTSSSGNWCSLAVAFVPPLQQAVILG